VIAIDQSHFEVGDFLSAAEIAAEPEKVGDVFPAELADEIVQKAHKEGFRR
jgi:hypothetical protein